MTSIAAPLSHFQQAQTAEIFETTIQLGPFEDTLNSLEGDQEMTDSDKQTLMENGYDDQDTYNAEIESTAVEPPQSDAVLTHAPSTILDEMDYLEEVDYEEVDPIEKAPDSHLVQESDTYKVDATTTHATPPPSNDQPRHPQIFSPASRMIVLPRPATPLPNLVINTNATAAETDIVDDDWPICLYTPAGQEYMLFRSDGDTEALFEDNWLKSQPLETFFSSIRQTLESELASLTTSFAMDEIVLAIPDLDVSIAEDNCYTREISLQDLVNLINGLCLKNGTERPETCKLHLSFQQRFIARFNQLVSLTSQIWEPSKELGDSEEHEGDVNIGEEREYEEFGDDENADELPEYEEEGEEDVQLHVKFQEQTETEDVGSQHENDLSAAEEDELYEDGDELFDTTVESTEVLVDQNDDVVEAEDLEEHDDEEQYVDEQGEEEAQDGAVSITGLAQEQLPGSTLHDTDEANGNDGDDDLISYEEAVDQTEDGQDYRQQYLNEEVSTSEDQMQNEENNITQNGDIPVVPQNDVPIAPESEEIETRTTEKVESVDAHMLDTDVSVSKRPLGEIIDPSVQVQEPPTKRAKS